MIDRQAVDGFWFALLAGSLGALSDSWSTMLVVWILVSLVAIGNASTASVRHAWAMLGSRFLLVIFGAWPLSLAVSALVPERLHYDPPSFAIFSTAILSWRGTDIFGDARRLLFLWKKP